MMDFEVLRRGARRGGAGPFAVVRGLLRLARAARRARVKGAMRACGAAVLAVVPVAFAFALAFSFPFAHA
jgi:hypothetical protein